MQPAKRKTAIIISLYRSFAISLILISAAEVSAQSARTAVEINHFFELKNVRNPQIGPDGKWVAYTVSESDLEVNKSETRLWMVSAEGGEPIPMTAKGYSAGNPRWSPDGKYLSFTASRNDGQTQVWALNRLGGEAQQITDIKQGVSDYEWSPDGSRLLLMIRDAKAEAEGEGNDKKPEPYVIDRLQFKRDYAGYLDRRRVHIYIYTPGDSAAIQITSGDYDQSQPAWSPDGKRITFVSNRTDSPDGNSNNNIWIVDADNTDKGQDLIQVTTSPGNDRSPAWSPDGRLITYVTVTDTSVIWYATDHLAVIPAEGGTARVLTEDWNVPILNSEQMYQAMKRLGRETLLVVYPGEHHGIRQPVFQKDRYERYLDWFGRFVKGENE